MEDAVAFERGKQVEKKLSLSQKIKVLVVDDHEVVRMGLRYFLLGQDDIEMVGEASTAYETVELVKKRTWDIVILDLSLPDKSGLELLKDILTINPKLRVLMMSMHPENQFGLRALKAGAAGYVNKESSLEQLPIAIRKVMQGQHYFSEALSEKLLNDLNKEGVQLPHECLSDREYEVFGLIASGMAVSQIAQKLHLSVKTVSTYRARILDKMQMHTNADLIGYFLTSNTPKSASL